MPLSGIFFVSLHYQSNRKIMFRKTDPNPLLDIFTAPSMQLGSRASKKYSDFDAWHNQFYSLMTTKIDEEIFKPLFPEGKTRYRGLLKHRMHAYSRCMWMNLRRMVIFQISTFQRSIFALFGPIREAFGSFKAISRKIFTSGADCYVSLRMTTLVRLGSKYAPF